MSGSSLASEDALPGPDAPPLIETNAVSRIFSTGRRHIKAVDGVSLRVGAGQTLALVGETGCGKSTLGRLLVGLEHPNSGAVRFEGVDLASLSARKLRALRVGMQMVFQDPLGSLDPRWPVRRVVAEPLVAHRYGSRAAVRERVDELLTTVGLDPSIGQRHPMEMSGGQRQRVGIARALALRPKLVVADEPVSALDVSVQAQIVNLLMDLQREFGLSYVVVAHGLEVVHHLSDQVAIMYLGKVVELGRTAVLFGSPAHPYTDSLLGSVPRPDPLARRSLRVIQGEVASPSRLPSGCRFHPRCPRRQDLCSREEPPLRELTPDQHVACHFPLEHPAAVSPTAPTPPRRLPARASGPEIGSNTDRPT